MITGSLKTKEATRLTTTWNSRPVALSEETLAVAAVAALGKPHQIAGTQSQSRRKLRGKPLLPLSTPSIGHLPSTTKTIMGTLLSLDFCQTTTSCSVLPNRPSLVLHATINYPIPSHSPAGILFALAAVGPRQQLHPCTTIQLAKSHHHDLPSLLSEICFQHQHKVQPGKMSTTTRPMHP